MYSRLLRSLGEAGEIEPETDGMLFEYSIDTSEFSEEVLYNYQYLCIIVVKITLLLLFAGRGFKFLLGTIA